MLITIKQVIIISVLNVKYFVNSEGNGCNLFAIVLGNQVKLIIIQKTIILNGKAHSIWISQYAFPRMSSNYKWIIVISWIDFVIRIQCVYTNAIAVIIMFLRVLLKCVSCRAWSSLLFCILAKNNGNKARD